MKVIVLFWIFLQDFPFWLMNKIPNYFLIGTATAHSIDYKFMVDTTEDLLLAFFSALQIHWYQSFYLNTSQQISFCHSIVLIVGNIQRNDFSDNDYRIKSHWRYRLSSLSKDKNLEDEITNKLAIQWKSR